MEYFYVLLKLRNLIRSINLQSKQIEKQLGISIPQLLCLHFLSTQPAYQSSAKQLKEFLHLNASTVTGLVKRMERKGLVARLPNQEDRRGTMIALTTTGLEQLKHTSTIFPGTFNQQLTQLPAPELDQLKSSIDLLLKVIGPGKLPPS